MPDDVVWIDSVRCFDAIAQLRSSPLATLTVNAAAIRDSASDESLRELAAAVARSADGVVATVNSLADEAILTALAVISADGW